MDKSNIKDIIENLPNQLTGKWIRKNNSYESELCYEINWIESRNRYYDAIFNDHKIEIKKGRSIWLDLVRYSEIINGIGEKNTKTCFFVPSSDKSSITDMFFVDTNRIIETLNLTSDMAAFILDINKNIHRQLNAQANLTLNDVRNITFYHHQF